MNSQGFGENIPPDKEQVIVYFLEKGQSEKQALDFFAERAARKWRNLRGSVISNWKVHAWEYIWNKR